MIICFDIEEIGEYFLMIFSVYGAVSPS